MNEKTPESRPRQGMDYGETSDLQEVHAAIQREKREPRVGGEPLSLWLIAVFGFAVVLGGAYLGRYSGDFSGTGLDPLGGAPRAGRSTAGGPGEDQQKTELTPFERGKKVYAANCATCHQPSGVGAPGQGYPPLVESEWVVGSTKRLGMIILKGLQGPITVKGQPYGSAVMQPWDKTLTDQKVADVMTYIRQEWGHQASAVSAEGVAALRQELAGREESMTEPLLKAVPDTEMLPGGDAAAAGGQPPAGAGTQPPAGGTPPPPQG